MLGEEGSGLGPVDWSLLLDQDGVRRLVELALAEDIGSGDITSRSVFSSEASTKATVVARSETVVCGIPLASYLGRQPGYGVDVHVEPLVGEGEIVAAGSAVAVLEGSIRSVLTAERVMLNFLMRLSGIASLSRQAIEAVPDDCSAKIYDTRKTTPGWRLLEKAAVRTGGAENHRVGLFDAVLIKDNHVAAAGSAARAVQLAQEAVRALETPVPIQVEVDTLEQLRQVLPVAPDMILLDNFDLPALRQAVEFVDGRVILEASGGITLQSIADVARTGVDRISMGQLTHSALPADLSLDIG